MTAFVQYPTLAEAFELRCLTVPTSDRSSFMDLVEFVRAELRVRARVIDIYTLHVPLSAGSGCRRYIQPRRACLRGWP